MSESTSKLGKIGVIVLCGGQSSRMGVPKWQLPVGQYTMLDHLLESIKASFDAVVVSCGAEQKIEIATADVVLVADSQRGCGPLEGIGCGLKQLHGHCEYGFVTACDIPWFIPEVVELLAEQIGDRDAAVPIIDERVYGMTALYKTTAHEAINNLVSSKSLKVSGLVNVLDTQRISKQQLQTVDRNLDTLRNINYPNDYLNYIEGLGLECPAEVRAKLG